MTANKRIFWNVVATYGRSLFSLLCGLFTARWVLAALGQIDYGLFGVVGGLVSFVEFLNNLLSTAVGRFYAYSVGAAKKDGNSVEGMTDCQGWFSVAVVMHTVVSVSVALVGYPAGMYAIKSFLVIPADRVDTCLTIWNFSLLSCFVSMMSVPFRAMYAAKQEIAELTIYSFATTSISVVCLYYMANHPGEWLEPYAFMMMLLAVVPQLIICVRAYLKYKECRFRIYECRKIDRYRELLSFSGSRFICAFSLLLGFQGVGVVVNKFLGPSRNAALSIATSISNHCSSLSNAFAGAFSPAISNAAGEGNYEYMRKLSYAVCSFSAVSVVMFALPLCIEIDYVLLLWLKDPPPYTSILSVTILLTAIVEAMTQGCWMAIMAIGRIAKFQFVLSLSFFAMFLTAVGGLLCGAGVYSICAAFCVGKILGLIIKIYYGYKIAGLSVRVFVFRVLIPISVLILLAGILGFLPRLLMGQSFLRLLLTIVVTEIVLLPSLWFFVLGPEAKTIIKKKIARKVR